jgi:hypothetical protein
MMGLQIRAFTLLAVILLIVDAAAFHGEYRDAAGHKLVWFWNKVSPAHWHGLGRGRDWATPGTPHH